MRAYNICKVRTLPNRSHFNPALRMMNKMSREGIPHKSQRDWQLPAITYHAVLNVDVLDLLRKIPDNSIQLMVCDPPYNLDIATWDRFSNYIEWAKLWLDEISRIITDYGNIVIFGGLQFQEVKRGDLLEIMNYLRHNTELRLVNLIIWYYKSGMSAHRFFANRHEEIAWYAKTNRYTFNLDEVRIPFDSKTKKEYMRDKRLRHESIEKGKNPTNVWDIPRLNANSKERVGHPTQKPSMLIRRIVRALSYPGSTVLDPFAGSGIITKICIEENRHSIISDTDLSLKKYLRMILGQQNKLLVSKPEVLYNADINIVSNWPNVIAGKSLVLEQSK